MKKPQEPDNQMLYLPIGMSLGISVGTAIGAGAGNIPLGMCIGVSIGVAVGAVIDFLNRKNKENPSDADADEINEE